MKEQINIKDLSPELREKIEEELLSKDNIKNEKTEYLMNKYNFDEDYAGSFISELEFQNNTNEADLKSIKKNVIFYKTDDFETSFKEFNSVEELKNHMIGDYANPNNNNWYIYKVFIDDEEKNYSVIVDIKFFDRK